MSEQAILSPTSHNLLPPGGRQELEIKSLQNSITQLDTTNSIYDPAEVGLSSSGQNGDSFSIVGEVSLNDAHGVGGEMVFVKLSSVSGEESVFLAGLTRDEQGSSTVAPYSRWTRLDEYVPRVIGRGGSSTEGKLSGTDLYGHEFSGGVSRQHLTVTLQKGAIKIEDTSSNGSNYRGKALTRPDPYGFTSIHTLTASEAARLRGLIKERNIDGIETFAGRPTIGRDTFPIDGHVDIRTWVGGGEAIVVDSKKYPKEFENLRASFDRNLGAQNKKGLFAKRDKRGTEAKALQAIYNTINEAMAYDLAFVLEEEKDIADKAPEHRKAALNNYLIEGKGVCRHMALAVSWLGGDAVSRGIIEGRFTTEVNQSSDGLGAHEWSRYVASDGEVYIVDVAQKFVGRLVDTLSKRSDESERWGYFRNKEERDSYRQRVSGGAVVGISGVVSRTTENVIITENDIPKG